MKRFSIVVLSVFVAVMFLVPSFVGASENFMVGTFYTSASLVDDRTEVGSINQLEPEGSKFYGNPFVKLKLNSEEKIQLWTRVSYNYLRLTANSLYPADLGGNTSDGAFELEGPSISLDISVPISRRWEVGGAVGVEFYNVNFDANGWWANGFQSQADWEANGPNSADGKTRKMDPEDAMAVSASVGMSVRISERVRIISEVRYEKFLSDIATSFAGYNNGEMTYQREGYAIDPSNFSFGLGVAYEFKL